mmetsp:Transcript_4047/g.4431  ORF Transcript_4047/g.4431 Transcript_4047/m.4431 type:complete len:146 (+) Transcript_4047:96-533(+)
MMKNLCFAALLFLVNFHASAAFVVRQHRSNFDDVSVSLKMTTNNEGDSISRREAFSSLMKTTTAVAGGALLMTTASPPALADIYDDEAAERKRKQAEDSAKGQQLVPAVLFGGTLLSVPFFFPNLLRLGTKLISGGEDDGYGKDE